MAKASIGELDIFSNRAIGVEVLDADHAIACNGDEGFASFHVLLKMGDGERPIFHSSMEGTVVRDDHLSGVPSAHALSANDAQRVVGEDRNNSFFGIIHRSQPFSLRGF